MTSKIADHCRSSSSLLYSPHCWYFLGTKEIIKFFFFPLPFHTCKSLGRDQNLLTSGILRPRELVSGIPVQWLGASPPRPCTQQLCPSSPPPSLAGMLTPLLGTGNCLLQLQPPRVEPGEASGVHLFLSLCRALENPSQFLLITPITTHLAPSSLGHLEPLFPDLVFTDFFQEGSEEGDPRNNHHGFSILGYRKDSLMQPQAMWWEPRLFQSDRSPLRLPPSRHTAFGACVATWPFSHWARSSQLGGKLWFPGCHSSAGEHAPCQIHAKARGS